MRRIVAVSYVCIATLFLAPLPSADADPIVQDGTVAIWWDGSLGGVALRGPGLRIDDDGYGSAPVGWTAGESGHLSGHFVFNPAPLFRTVVVDGVTYTADVRGSMVFQSARFIVPSAAPNDLVTFTTTFTMDGSITGVDASGMLLFNQELTGGGTVTTQARHIGDGVYIKNFGARIYEFEAAPVPEPATLILVGAGLAGVALRRRQVT